VIWSSRQCHGNGGGSWWQPASWVDLGAHDVSAHGGNDVELPTVEDIPQLFAIEPGAVVNWTEAIEVAGLIGGESLFCP
jgi:hypothetical protein